MSLERFGAELIMGLAVAKQGPGAVAMLGRQHLDLNDKKWAEATRKRLGYRMDDIVELGPEAYAEPFFERLGSTSIDSIDVSKYQGANLIHDMNQPIPEALAGRFDLLHDGGTMEHVFHIPTYLANCMKLLRPGGKYVGVVPADNWMGHGFYQFSPELFFRVFSKENGFQLRAHGLGVWSPRHRVFRIPSDSKWAGRMEPQFHHPSLLLIVAEKLENREPFAAGWPQQGDYATRWADETDGRQSNHPEGAYRQLRKKIAHLTPAPIRRRIAAELVHSRRRRARNALLSEVSSADELLAL